MLMYLKISSIFIKHISAGNRMSILKDSPTYLDRLGKLFWFFHCLIQSELRIFWQFFSQVWHLTCFNEKSESVSPLVLLLEYLCDCVLSFMRGILFPTLWYWRRNFHPTRIFHTFSTIFAWKTVRIRTVISMRVD